MIKRTASIFVGVFVPKSSSSSSSSPSKASSKDRSSAATSGVPSSDAGSSATKKRHIKITHRERSAASWSDSQASDGVQLLSAQDRPSQENKNAATLPFRSKDRTTLETEHAHEAVMHTRQQGPSQSPGPDGDDNASAVTRVRLKLVQHSSATTQSSEHEHSSTQQDAAYKLQPLHMSTTHFNSSVTCHHDKTRSDRPKMHCSTPNCNTIWCKRCLEKHYFSVDDVFVANASFTCPRCRGTCLCAKCKDRRGEKRVLVTHHKRPAVPKSSTATPSDKLLSRPVSTPTVFERPQTRKRSGIVTLAPRRLANTVWDVNDEDEDDSRDASDNDESDHSLWSTIDHKVSLEQPHPAGGGARSRRRVSGQQSSSLRPMQPSRRSNRQRRTTWHRLDSDEWSAWGARNSGGASRDARVSIGSAQEHPWTFTAYDEHQSDLGVTDESDVDDGDSYHLSTSSWRTGWRTSGSGAGVGDPMIEPVWTTTAESWGAPGTALEEFEQLPYEPIIDFGTQHFDADDDSVTAMHVEHDLLHVGDKAQSKKRGVVWREGPERRRRRLESLDSAPSASASPPALEPSTSTTENSPAPAVVGSPPPYTAVENMLTPPETTNVNLAAGCLGGGSLGSRSSSYIDLDRYTDAEIGQLVRRALTLGQDMFAATSQLVATSKGLEAGRSTTTKIESSQTGTSLRGRSLELQDSASETGPATTTTASKLEFRNPFLPTAQADAHFGVAEESTCADKSEDGGMAAASSSKAEDDSSTVLDDSWVLRDDVKFDEDSGDLAMAATTGSWTTDVVTLVH
ncbi:hypothetical protein ACM66B_004472 [Microbotryomycetes sp. NB124-2]